MAQRSARARSKLDKISGGGIAKLGHGGLATPSTSTGSPSLSSFSSRSFGTGRSSSNSKSVFRSFMDAKSEKIRGTLAEKISPVGNARPRLELEIESTPTLRKWDGGGRPSTGWDKIRRDPDLWFPDGDTLVYLRDKDSISKEDQPFRAASFRVRSSTLYATNSPFLMGSMYDYDDVPQSPTSMSSLMSTEDITQVPSHSSRDMQGIEHELFFRAPRTSDKAEIYRHHTTTRNFFAVLFNRPLVGVSLGQTLIDLVERMDLYMAPGDDNVSELLRFLIRKEFDDVRNMPDLAAGMLQFAERYQLTDLYRECFVHCVGMMNRLELSPDYQQISPITRALIDRANLEIQVRTGKSDTVLAHSGFLFTEMWPQMSAGYPPARHAFDRFQKFLVKHYQTRFGSWPPTGDKFGRMLYLQLQRDFAALYDYLVDRDVQWEPVPASSSGSTSSYQRATGAQKLINPYKQAFRADDNSLQFTDILLSFDHSNKYPHIPHAYPLVPDTKTTTAVRSNKQSNFFGKRNANADKYAEKANALALMEATNVDALHSTPQVNSLVDAYQRMEKTDRTIEIDPHDARKGRWLLIYAILQTLAIITVDAPGLKWHENVDYFLCAQLKGTPPWEQQPQASRGGEEEDYCQYRSHCWTVPYQWSSQASAKTLQSVQQAEQRRSELMAQRAELNSPVEELPVELQEPPRKRHTQSSHHSSNHYRSGVDDLGIGPGILDQDDFEPGALDALNAFGMNNASGSILGNPIASNLVKQPTAGTAEYDSEGSSDADDEDDDIDVDMDEHGLEHYLATTHARASAISRISRESGAAGMYAPWGGVSQNF